MTGRFEGAVAIRKTGPDYSQEVGSRSHQATPSQIAANRLNAQGKPVDCKSQRVK
jgi:hypothetical protein